ncbi:MAG TPA: heme exporter protein CcmB [Steroidobacteraceae bacterium]|nr:heme exporter protein CcmB [Steroidobacteraceae bacterium]
MLTTAPAAIRPTSSLRAGRLLFVRDVLLAMRRWEHVADPLVFFVMVTTLFPLALSPQLSQLRDVAPGVLWVAALLSSLLAADSLLKSDSQDGTLEQYVLSGQPLTLLLLAKTAAHWILTGLPLVLISPLVAIALGAPTGALTTIMVGLALGTLTLSFLGAIGAALTIGLRRGSLLLSLLVMPLAMPLLIFGSRSAELAIAGESAAGPLYLLASLLVLAITLAPLTAAAAVRIGLD